MEDMDRNEIFERRLSVGLGEGGQERLALCRERITARPPSPFLTFQNHHRCGFIADKARDAFRFPSSFLCAKQIPMVVLVASHQIRAKGSCAKQMHRPLLDKFKQI